MRTKLWLAVALCPALMASQCIEPLYLRVDPGPEADDVPAFRFIYDGDPVTYVDELQVTTCETRRVPTWRIVRDGQSPTDMRPLRIIYGQLPRGYRETTAAQPLQAGGCYRATAEYPAPVNTPVRTLPGRETFRLLPNGQVIAGEPVSVFNNPRPFRQLNRAAVGCTRGYRRADTAADSAAVDAREYGVLDARVTCGWLFSQWPDVVAEPVGTERATLTLAGLLALYVGVGLLLDQIPEVEP
jgi:hypothetical protein